MTFLRPFSAPETWPTLIGEGVELRPPRMNDYEAWSALRAQSRAFLAPWEPAWPADDLTRSAFRARMRRYTRDVRADLAYPYFILRSDTGELAGGLTLGQIRRGVAQTASLGYWMGAPHAGRGLMTAAVRTLLPHAFSGMRLRRIEAACLPNNAASIALLERIGFVKEGLARSYLCIADVWRDHLLYAILASDPQR